MHSGIGHINYITVYFLAKNAIVSSWVALTQTCRSTTALQDHLGLWLTMATFSVVNQKVDLVADDQLWRTLIREHLKDDRDNSLIVF